MLMKIDEEQSPIALEFPMGYLAKAATASDSKNMNYNTLLRYHCFQIFSFWNVRKILGAIAEGAPRQKTMENLGYAFYAKKKKWDGNFKSDRPVLVGVLDSHDKLSAAIVTLKQSLGPMIQNFPLRFDYQNVPMTGRTRLMFSWTKRSA